ncbi:MAG: preprotein translocase subunit SecG [Methylococcales bacterium]|nr:preprotein translocase subunit SecG [Methylococcales bacterium]
MYQAIIIVHVLLGLGVIGFVLIQQGKGADAGAAFGSASSGSVFGAQGASSFLSRTTAVLAALFFSTSLGLAILVGQQETEVDLMGAPEVEEVMADVPQIGLEESITVTTDTESIPVIEESIEEVDVVLEKE